MVNVYVPVDGESYCQEAVSKEIHRLVSVDVNNRLWRGALEV